MYLLVNIYKRIPIKHKKNCVKTITKLIKTN